MSAHGLPCHTNFKNKKYEYLPMSAFWIELCGLLDDLSERKELLHLDYCWAKLYHQYPELQHHQYKLTFTEKSP